MALNILKLPSFRIVDSSSLEVFDWKGRVLKGTPERIYYTVGESVAPTYTVPHYYILPENYSNRSKYPILWHSGIITHQLEDLTVPRLEFFYEPKNFLGRTSSLIRLPKSVIVHTPFAYYNQAFSQTEIATNNNLEYFNNKSIFISDLGSNITFDLLSGIFPPGIDIYYNDGYKIIDGTHKYMYGECLFITVTADSAGGFVALKDSENVLLLQKKYLSKFRRTKWIIYYFKNTLFPPPHNWKEKIKSQLGGYVDFRSIHVHSDVDHTKIMLDIRNFYGT